MSLSAEKLQALYYTNTASSYDAMHGVDCKTDEYYYALHLIETLCASLQLSTLLDVGSGTGRSVVFLLDHGKDVRGIEPVAALIEQAGKKGVPKGCIVQGSGYSLPFADDSFDAVIECGILHHVASPSRVVSEMTRVARRAVFLSDCNRFGQGGMPPE
jgi:ubiquinone/menaquinone biosynthesis C-methylase UbiE